MDNYKINIHYAKALMMLAVDMNCVDTVSEDMRLVQQVCTENRLLNKVFSNPTIKEAQKAAVVEDLFKGQISEVSLAFLRFVVRKRRAVSLRGIATAFVEMWREKNNVVLAEFVTAVDIDQQLLEEAKQKIVEYTGKEVEFNTSVDNRRIGGFYLTFDNKLYDDRISTKLIKLRNEFSRNEYESKIARR